MRAPPVCTHTLASAVPREYLSYSRGESQHRSCYGHQGGTQPTVTGTPDHPRDISTCSVGAKNSSEQKAERTVSNEGTWWYVLPQPGMKRVSSIQLAHCRNNAHRTNTPPSPFPSSLTNRITGARSPVAKGMTTLTCVDFIRKMIVPLIA